MIPQRPDASDSSPVHLLGVCGTAMASLAGLLKESGLAVTGSDEGIYPPMSELLATLGVPVRSPYKAENLPDPCRLVVVGNAISRGNLELEAVLENKLPYVSMPELLKEWFIRGRTSVVISGTHGKTSTSSLVAWILDQAGCRPGYLVGGVPHDLPSSYRVGAGDLFVVEGDEYDTAYFDKGPKFLHYLPDILVVGNVEYDHADIYPDIDAVRSAFRLLVRLVPRNGLTIIGTDSAVARSLSGEVLSNVETFSVEDESATWTGRYRDGDSDACELELFHDGEPYLEARGAFWGEAALKNVLAATAVAHRVRVPQTAIAAALGSFRGVRRRLEIRGVGRGVTIIDDFAHHPSAVRATLAAARQRFGSASVWAIFEPRSYTARSRHFQQDFVEALAMADRVILAKVFRSARLSDDEELAPAMVVESLAGRSTPALYIEEVDAIVDTICAEAEEGDVVVVMSNGGFGGIHARLLEALGD